MRRICQLACHSSFLLTAGCGEGQVRCIHGIHGVQLNVAMDRPVTVVVVDALELDGSFDVIGLIAGQLEFGSVVGFIGIADLVIVLVGIGHFQTPGGDLVGAIGTIVDHLYHRLKVAAGCHVEESVLILEAGVAGGVKSGVGSLNLVDVGIIAPACQRAGEQTALDFQGCSSNSSHRTGKSAAFNGGIAVHDGDFIGKGTIARNGKSARQAADIIIIGAAIQNKRSSFRVGNGGKIRDSIRIALTLQESNIILESCNG